MRGETGKAGADIMREKVLVVIPAYNEEANIEAVVEELVRDYPELDYLVVNDGSRDRTGAICRKRDTTFWTSPSIWGWQGVFRPG